MSVSPERRERFPRRERLRGRRAFRTVYERGTAYRGRLMVLILYRSPELERSVGFVTSRKVGTAVQRNRARRLLRESYRRLRSEMLETGHHAQYVFIARGGLPGATFADTFAEMRRLFTEAGVLDAGFPPGS